MSKFAIKDLPQAFKAITINRWPQRLCLALALGLVLSIGAVWPLKGLTATNGAVISGQVVLAGKGPVKEAVVYFDGPMVRRPPSRHPVMNQRQISFSPHVLAVPAGTTVDFPNNDEVYHNVFAYYDAKRFDLGLYPKGAKKSVRFEKPGLVVLFCNIHANMNAFIMVTPNPWAAVTDSKGRFRIEGVPPGSYMLKTWHERYQAVNQSLTVPGSGVSAVQITLKSK